MELANSIIALQPGMYILRHPKTGLPPISVSRAAGSAGITGRVEALYTPGTDGGVLRSGSDCIVMHVLNAPVELLVTAYLEKAGATVPALRVDKIALEADPAVGTSQPPSGRPIEIPSKGISIIGHIERRGDVLATDGQRLGDPSADLRLEGFQIMWPDKPDGVDLAYCVRQEGAGTVPIVTTGKFCGTRNAATRIVEVTFSLTGPKATHYGLIGKAHFSGGYEVDLQSGMALSGPSGFEHLTGLSIASSSGVRKNAGKGAWEPSARTKVFKNVKPSKELLAQVKR